MGIVSKASFTEKTQTIFQIDSFISNFLLARSEKNKIHKSTESSVIILLTARAT